MQTIRLGSITIDAVSDGELGLPIAMMLPGADVAAASALGGIDAKGIALAPLTTFIIRAGGRVILVDTGVGPSLKGFEDMDAGRPVGLLPAALAGAGVTPESVDFVVSTHLHGDHIGWNTLTTDGVSTPMFPRARYVITRVDWENRATIAGNGATARSLAPLEAAGQLMLIDDDGHAVVPGVELLFTPGHTPGHTSILVREGGSGAVITGDAAHHPIEMEDPDLKAVFDSDPDQAVRSRHALVARIEAEGLTVLGGHFPAPTAGQIVRVEQQRRWRWLGA